MSFHRYLIVPEAEVSGSLRSAAEFAMRRVGMEHGESVPEVTWIVPWPEGMPPNYRKCHVTDVSVHGQTTNYDVDGTIRVYIRADVSVQQVGSTAAHEMRHVVQFRQGIKLDETNRAEWEAEAVACATHDSDRHATEVAALSVTAWDIIDRDLERARARAWGNRASVWGYK